MKKYDETKWLNGQGEQVISGSLNDNDFQDQLVKWLEGTTNNEK